MQLNVQTTPPAQVEATPIEPYVGPRSFRKDQREFFFGRDEEADELVSVITAHSAVLLYSQSGAGKTSLLNAKLIPKLEEEETFYVLPPMRVHPDESGFDVVLAMPRGRPMRARVGRRLRKASASSCHR